MNETIKIPTVPFERSFHQINKERDWIKFFQQRKTYCPPAIVTLHSVRFAIIIYYLSNRRQIDIKQLCLTNLIMKQKGNVDVNDTNKCSRVVLKHLESRYPLTDKEKNVLLRISHMIDETNYFKPFEELNKVIFGV